MFLSPEAELILLRFVRIFNFKQNEANENRDIMTSYVQTA